MWYNDNETIVSFIILRHFALNQDYGKGSW